MVGNPATLGGLILALLVSSPEAPPAEPPATPSADMLLFLAEFSDREGRFVDPTTIEGNPADGRSDAPAADPDDDDEEDRPSPPDR